MTIVADKFSPNTTSDIGKDCLGYTIINIVNIFPLINLQAAI